MTSNGTPKESRYSDRSDGVETKTALLQAAHKRGDYRLAEALADSLKDGLTAERLLDGQRTAREPAELSIAGWLRAADLPRAWREWAAEWPYFQVVALEETAGLAREGEPVDVGIEAPAAWCESLTREVRVALVDEPGGALRVVPSQVYAEERRRGAGGEKGVRTARLVWRASVPAGGTARFVALAGNRAAELPHYVTDLAVRGEGVALEIENEHVVATLSPQTGQLERLRYKRAHGLELFAGGEGHGEPPHIDWAHDYLASGKFQKFRVTNWDRVRNFEVVRGPVCTIVRRWGFPHSPLHPVFTAARMFVDVQYVFYAGAPYFLKEGRMEATQDFELNYLRDDEWVFSGYSFTDLLWMDEHGKAHEGAVPREHAERMWGVGFFNRQSGDAFFSIRLRHELEGSGGVRLYHADAPALDYKGHGQLWSRWALRGDPRLRAGDTLHQRNAYVVEPYGESGGARLEQWRRRLLSPLVVRAGGNAEGLGGDVGSDRLAGLGESGPAAALKAGVWEALREVRDDMFYTADANVADMGYVYDVRVRHGDVEVLMTMPHRGRPRYRYLGNPISERLKRLPGVRSVTITPVWEPEWTPHRMSDKGWRAMGLAARGDA